MASQTYSNEEPENRATAIWNTHLELEGLNVVGAGGEVCVDQGAATEGSCVATASLLQSHAVSLAVATVEALAIPTCCTAGKDTHSDTHNL